MAETALPIRMLHDRILLDPGEEAGGPKSSAGIVIPTPASMGKRLVWGKVVAAGPHVRQTNLGDRRPLRS